MVNKMIDLTITQALQKLKSRAISATELTRAYLNRIEKFGEKLNCYITTTPDRALADAAAAAQRLGMPHEVLNLKEDFNRLVVEDFARTSRQT